MKAFLRFALPATIVLSGIGATQTLQYIDLSVRGDLYDAEVFVLPSGLVKYSVRCKFPDARSHTSDVKDVGVNLFETVSQQLLSAGFFTVSTNYGVGENGKVRVYWSHDIGGYLALAWDENNNRKIPLSMLMPRDLRNAMESIVYAITGNIQEWCRAQEKVTSNIPLEGDSEAAPQLGR